MASHSKAKQFRRRLKLYLLPLIDFVLTPLVYLAALTLKRVRQTGIEKLPYCKSLLLSVGVFPIQDHYYEPLFNSEHLQHPLSDNRPLPGIEWNTHAQLALLSELSYANELSDLPEDKQNQLTFYWNNGAFYPGDASYWYNIIRHKKPARIIEVGSGKSTLLAIKAIAANQADDPNYHCQHTCIEPYAAPWLEQTGVSVIRERVECADITIFKELQKNDILFIDSTHMIRPQGDVLFEYLELLPQINPGVIVHIHDIFSPRDYPEDWVTQKISFWNEQYLLEAFLSQNSQWEIIGALNFLFNQHKDEFLHACPVTHKGKEPHSFYIQKI